ncbi:hypothetical protein IWX49DRAFT_566491 [Phyllosticta citricarpa]
MLLFGLNLLALFSCGVSELDNVENSVLLLFCPEVSTLRLTRSIYPWGATCMSKILFPSLSLKDSKVLTMVQFWMQVLCRRSGVRGSFSLHTVSTYTIRTTQVRREVSTGLLLNPL